MDWSKSTLEERVSWLIDTYCGGNAREFDRRVGIREGSTSVFLSRSRKGHRPDMKRGRVKRISEAFHVSIDWLAAGIGDPAGAEAIVPAHNDLLREIVDELDALHAQGGDGAVGRELNLKLHALLQAGRPPTGALLEALETAELLGVEFDDEVIAAVRLLAGDSAPNVRARAWVEALHEASARRKLLLESRPIIGVKP